ncbi:MAG: cold shock domain-containing protein [Pseudomonadota bacterium]
MSRVKPVPQGDPPDYDVEIRGIVKWFDPVRGYGFIEPDDGSNDVLLHAAIVRASGAERVPERSEIVVQAKHTDRGLQAVAIIEMEEPEPNLMSAAERRAALRDSPPGDLEPAKVKWFDKKKGFGFVNLLGDTRDVFIHMETLRVSGLNDLSTSEAVLVRVSTGPRGAMATDVVVWNSPAALEEFARDGDDGDDGDGDRDGDGDEE